jgi:HAMP domain-containing protein
VADTNVHGYRGVFYLPSRSDKPDELDPQQFYNSASAAVAGVGAAALSFRLLPPLSPMRRARRLLALTLWDLRRLAAGSILRSPDAWAQRVYSRLCVLPDAAEPLQRLELVAALSVGIEIIRLRRICRRFDLGPHLDAALEAMARGDSAMTIVRLTRLDEALAARPREATLRARSTILAMSEALTEHATYFDAEAPG